MPKPSHLRSVKSLPGPTLAAPGLSAIPSGVVAEVTPSLPDPKVTPSPAAAQDASSPPRSLSVETTPKPGKRRSFTAAEKLRIVREAAACTRRGDIEALLRREGIYSSLLAAWRKQLSLHGSEALAGRKPGRKPKQDAKDRYILELEKRAARLEAKLSLAEKLIDLQKKVSAILGINLATDGES